MVLAVPQGRNAVYARLARRNRTVGMLRIAVPVSGALILCVLLAQIYVSSLGARYGIGQIIVTPDAMIVEAPEYAGVLEDGSTYRVWADQARANVANTDVIGLGNAAIVLNRSDGVQMQASTPVAELDTITQSILVPQTTEISDSLGTQGTMDRSVFDWQNKILTTEGPVAIAYADGTTIKSEGLVYDLDARVWTFSRATVILPATPGEVAP